MNKKTISFIFVMSIMFVSGIFTETVKEKALRIVKNSVVADTHQDTPTIIYEGIDILEDSEKRQVDFPKMIRGGINSPVFAIWISNSKDNKDPEIYALKVLSKTMGVIGKSSKFCDLSLSCDDITDITGKGKIAITFSLENSSVFHSVEYVDIFYRLGIRMASLTHWSSNFLCDSSTGKEKWGGLSPLGEKIIKRMNEVGMIVDISHLSDKSVEDILKISSAPIIASHSCVRKLGDHKRNLNDELIKKIAEKGGLIDINFASFYLDTDAKNEMSKIWKEYGVLYSNLKKKYPDEGIEYKKEKEILDKNRKKRGSGLRVGLSRVVDHIKYIRDLVGIDFVGIGTDFEGIGDTAPIGLEDASKMPNLVVEMLKEGFNEAEIKKVLGQNFLRLYKKVESAKTTDIL